MQLLASTVNFWSCGLIMFTYMLDNKVQDLDNLIY